MSYHFNPKTGKAGLCEAKKGPCPLGGGELHGATAADAAKAYENFVSNDSDPTTETFSTLSKGAGQEKSMDKTDLYTESDLKGAVTPSSIEPTVARLPSFEARMGQDLLHEKFTLDNRERLLEEFKTKDARANLYEVQAKFVEGDASERKYTAAHENFIENSREWESKIRQVLTYGPSEIQERKLKEAQEDRLHLTVSYCDSMVKVAEDSFVSVFYGTRIKERREKLSKALAEFNEFMDEEHRKTHPAPAYPPHLDRI